MKLTGAPCPHCLFDKQDIEMPDLEYDHSKTEHLCDNCDMPMEILVHVYNSATVPF